MMKPSLGRIVHISEGGRVYAALVVSVGKLGSEAYDSQTVNLIFWTDQGAQKFRSGVPYSNELGKTDHWFWPPVLKPTVEEVKKFQESIKNAAEPVKVGDGIS